MLRARRPHRPRALERRRTRFRSSAPWTRERRCREPCPARPPWPAPANPVATPDSNRRSPLLPTRCWRHGLLRPWPIHPRTIARRRPTTPCPWFGFACPVKVGSRRSVVRQGHPLELIDFDFPGRRSCHPRGWLEWTTYPRTPSSTLAEASPVSFPRARPGSKHADLSPTICDASRRYLGFVVAENSYCKRTLPQVVVLPLRVRSTETVG